MSQTKRIFGMSKMFKSFENQLAQFGRNHIGTYQAVDMELMFTSQRLQNAYFSQGVSRNIDSGELMLHDCNQPSALALTLYNCKRD
eukprot:403363717